MAIRNVKKERALSLTALRAALRYDPETGVFTRLTNNSTKYPLGSEAGTVLSTGYRVIRVCNSRFLAHRLAWFYVYGVWPSEIDHIDRQKDNNKFCNLRESTRSQNMANALGRKNSQLGIKHVSRKRNGFAVRVMRGNKYVFRKTFPCLGQAVRARNTAIMQSQNHLGG